jgi:hypothetical protein
MEIEGDPRGLAKPFARARLAPYGTRRMRQRYTQATDPKTVNGITTCVLTGPFSVSCVYFRRMRLGICRLRLPLSHAPCAIWS